MTNKTRNKTKGCLKRTFEKKTENKRTKCSPTQGDVVKNDNASKDSLSEMKAFLVVVFKWLRKEKAPGAMEVWQRGGALFVFAPPRARSTVYVAPGGLWREKPTDGKTTR